jgi:hypothetical protein
MTNNDDPKPKPRAKFVLIDPLAIDKRLLYEIGGKHYIGLILSTERNAKTGPVVGDWHVLRDARRSLLS